MDAPLREAPGLLLDERTRAPSHRDSAPKRSAKENGKLWDPAVLWDLEQIPALLLAAAVKGTAGTLMCMLDSVLVRNKSHNQGENTMLIVQQARIWAVTAKGP